MIKRARDQQAQIAKNCSAIASDLSNFENFKMSIGNDSDYDKTIEMNDTTYSKGIQLPSSFQGRHMRHTSMVETVKNPPQGRNRMINTMMSTHQTRKPDLSLPPIGGYDYGKLYGSINVPSENIDPGILPSPIETNR